MKGFFRFWSQSSTKIRLRLLSKVEVGAVVGAAVELVLKIRSPESDVETAAEAKVGADVGAAVDVV